MFSCVDSEYVHSGQCPWSSLCYLGESQPPLPAQMPSLKQLPRATPRLDSTHIYACRHIQSRRQTRGAAHPAFPSSLAPHSQRTHPSPSK